MTFDQIAIALLGSLALPGQRSELAQMGASVRHAGAAVLVLCQLAGRAVGHLCCVDYLCLRVVPGLWVYWISPQREHGTEPIQLLPGRKP